MLVAISTSDGQVVQQVNLQTYYSGSANEALQVVNNVVIANDLIGVLVGVRNKQGPYPNSNGMDYQDLYVYKTFLVGDINEDGQVDVVDLLLFVASWGSTVGQANYDAASDLNGDGSVDALDLLLMVQNWGD